MPWKVMAMAAHAAGWLLIVAAWLGSLYALAAGFAVERFFRRAMPKTRSFPPVTVLKPLYRDEPRLVANLEGYFCQDYPAPVQLLFGVQASDDPAARIVGDLAGRHPQADVAVAVTGRSEGGNPKIANLIGMMEQAKHGVLVLSDSDIGVAPDYLSRIVAALEQPGTGAVTCCYVADTLPDPWSRLAGQGIDYHFLPSVILGAALGLAKPCFGSTIALTRKTLDAIGGFAAFRDRLADDYEIGHAVRRLGLSVALPPMIVTHTCAETSAAALFRHELRWARTIRAVDPAGFAGSAVTHALPLSLLGFALLGCSPPATATLALALLCRLSLKLRIDRALGRHGTGLPLFPLRDMLSFAVFVASFCAGRVDWRGSRFRVHADGQLARE